MHGPRSSAPVGREEERTLHDRLVARDEAALLECFDRFAHLLYCAAVTATRDRTAAEELTYSRVRRGLETHQMGTDRL